MSRKITQHTAITDAEINPSDVMEWVDVSDTTDNASGTNKKMTYSTLNTLFPLAGGKSGGQTINGDTAASGALTLSSTANATKGNIVLGTSAYDEANNRLGIGKTNPAEAVDVVGNIAVSGTVDGIDIATDVAANTTHRTSDNGSDHSFIDQDVTTTAVPTFAGPLTIGSEVAITGATTATISRQHLCSGTTYTLTLPAVSGNAGKYISFRMHNSLTGIVTIDGNASEKIWSPRGSVDTMQFIAGESLVLYCDGTQWQVIHDTLARVAFHAYESSAAQSINNSTNTVVQMDEEMYDTHGWYDTATDRFTPKAPGIYQFTGTVSLTSLPDGKQIWLGLRKNGSDLYWPNSIMVGGTCNPAVNGSVDLPMNGTTDYIELIIWQDSGGALNTKISAGEECRLAGNRIMRETS